MKGLGTLLYYYFCLWSVLFCAFLFMQAPVVVDPKSLIEGIDLLSANDHLTHSEVSTFLVTI